MKIVAADESRADARDLYVPMPKGAMAHRSYPSPDGRWVLVAEMTDRGAWTPCRLVPMNASSPGRHVGPPDADCWFAGWSPDGAWMYFSSNAGHAFHAWRQRFSAGNTLDPPEQITSGPTEEEGLTIAPDGRSFITAVGMTRRSVWVHDSMGERAVSLEGYALDPTFTPDGKKLVYFVAEGASAHRGELWIADLDTGLNERLLPGFSVGTGGTAGARSPFDVSADGQWVVFDTSRHGRKEHALADAARPPIATAAGSECRRGRTVVRSKRRHPVPRTRSRLWLCVPRPSGWHRSAESPRAPGHRKPGRLAGRAVARRVRSPESRTSRRNDSPAGRRRDTGAGLR